MATKRLRAPGRPCRLAKFDTVPERVTMSREVVLELDRTLSALPPRQRRVVTMRDVFGMPTEQVRARAVLRAALAGYHGG